jgi:predicted GIY-YIG superfamily endonuclease
MEIWVYILKCSDGSYYTGITEDLDVRLAQHENGTLAGYTRSKRPVKLVFSEAFSTYNEAISAERQIKGWSRAKKEALIRNDFELLHELAQCQNQSRYAERHTDRKH